MTTSIIISFKQSDDDRRNNLRGLLPYLIPLISSDIELIVVEQDSESRLGWICEIEGYDQVKHLFIKNSGVFNKGLGYNVGAKHSNGDCLLFTDVDLFIHINGYMGSVAYMKKCDVLKPYKTLHYLDKQNTCHFMESYDMGIIRHRGCVQKTIRPSVISGGIFTIKRQTFFALKGFDERCAGYGYEDDILDTKMLKAGLKIRFLEADCIHAYHKSPRDKGDAPDEYYSFFDRNKNLYRWYMTMTREQVLEVIDNVAIWGEADYECIAH